MIFLSCILRSRNILKEKEYYPFLNNTPIGKGKKYSCSFGALSKPKKPPIAAEMKKKPLNEKCVFCWWKTTLQAGIRTEKMGTVTNSLNGFI